MQTSFQIPTSVSTLHLKNNRETMGVIPTHVPVDFSRDVMPPSVATNTSATTTANTSIFPQPQAQVVAPTLMPASLIGASLQQQQQTNNAQHQMLWQQALQSLSVNPNFPAQAQANVASTGASASATPYLALLTMPHLMQHNLQQAALQQQQQQQLQPSNVASYPSVPMMQSMSSLSNTGFTFNEGSNVSNEGVAVEPNRKRSRTSQTPATAAKPSIVSIAGMSNATPSHPIDGMDNLQPPTEKSAADVAKMSAAERRRYERNFREQQRSYRISQQIKELRDVLEASNVPFRPNKFSILVNVAEYIQQLQGRAIMLDSEHQKLITTIRCTTDELEGKAPSNELTSLSSSEGDDEDSPGLSTVTDSYTEKNSTSDSALLVRGIEYESVFQHCPFPLGLTSLDGNVLATNEEFEVLMNPNYNSKTSMKDQSFFVFIRNHQDIFEAMSALLKQSTASLESGEETTTLPEQLLFWRGQIVTVENETVR